MLHLAIFQFAIGFFLIAAVFHLTRRIAAKIFATELTCDAISPDSALTCRREPGHPGWCQHKTQSWHEEVWNMDHWCDTLTWWTADVENGDPTERAPIVPRCCEPGGPECTKEVLGFCLNFDLEMPEFFQRRFFATSSDGTTVERKLPGPDKIFEPFSLAVDSLQP